MKEPTRPPTMVKVLHLLTAEDRMIICFHLRKNSIQYSGVHEGLLPFVDLEEAVKAVFTSANKNAAERPAGRRRLLELASKMKGPLHGESGASALQLDDMKVFRRFGPHPERGQAMKWLPLEKVTVALRNRFGRLEPDDDVHVAPVVALKKVDDGPYHKGFWQVNVADKHRHVVERWLIDNLR